MFDVYVTKLQIHAATLLVKANKIYAYKDGTDGTLSQQVAGKIGEGIVRKGLGYIPFPDRSIERHDGGYDLMFDELKVDIKTMRRKVPVQPNYVHNFFLRQKKYSPQVYIFCSFNYKKSVLTICGYLLKDSLFVLGEVHKAGEERKRADGTSLIMKADNVEVRQSVLTPCKSFRDLSDQLNSIVP